MKIQIINGPNLNLLGSREKEIYGDKSLMDLEEYLVSQNPKVSFSFFQSNIEGEIIEVIHDCIRNSSPLIINPGGYSHTSVAIHDALMAMKYPKIEVHISNIHQREHFRHHSLTAQACNGVIAGLGMEGYSLAVKALELLLSKSANSTI